MMNVRQKQKLGIMLLAAVFSLGAVRPVFAQQSNSTNYSVDQAYFGSGAELEMNSNNYKSSAGAGDSTAGSVEGVNYGGNTGSPSSSEPLLEVTVGGSTNDHGVLDPDETVYGTAVIHVRTYNGSGYIVQVAGMPPNQQVHTIPGLATPSTAQRKVEQFGINMRANSIPLIDNATSTNFGADPVQVPDETFSYGIPAPDYDTANLFKYVSGDVVAQSVTASGETRYTMSYIMNLADLTPAGQYRADLSVVVSAKF